MFLCVKAKRWKLFVLGPETETRVRKGPFRKVGVGQAGVDWQESQLSHPSLAPAYSIRRRQVFFSIP
jgi:hypothetical protein